MIFEGLALEYTNRRARWTHNVIFRIGGSEVPLAWVSWIRKKHLRIHRIGPCHDVNNMYKIPWKPFYISTVLHGWHTATGFFPGQNRCRDLREVVSEFRLHSIVLTRLWSCITLTWAVSVRCKAVTHDAQSAQRICIKHSTTASMCKPLSYDVLRT